MSKLPAVVAIEISSAANAIAAGLRSRVIDRSRLSDQVTAQLERLIVSGEIKPGDTLPSERELMSLFGVGRTSIREALFALQRKGIVSAQPGQRPVVTAPRAEALVSELSGTVRLFLATEPGTREFQLARRFFEPALARYAAIHATDADISRMANGLAACDATANDADRFVDADVDFHFAIVQATHSQLLIALHRAVLDWLREQRIISIEPIGSSLAAQRAHRAIFEAIRARQPDRAESAMLAHLEQVERYYWKANGDAQPIAGRRATRKHPRPTAATARRRAS
jgi:GntR family transcriptional regulator, sialic acid-inducible nan operon repressor